MTDALSDSDVAFVITDKTAEYTVFILNVLARPVKVLMLFLQDLLMLFLQDLLRWPVHAWLPVTLAATWEHE